MADAELDLPERAKCRGCGYSLHGLIADRCSECGLPFDRRAILADLRAEKIKLPYDARAKRLLSPPSWWVVAIAIGPWVTIWFPLSAISPFSSDQPTQGTFAGTILFGLALGLLFLKVADSLRALREYDLNLSQRKIYGKSWPVLSLICAMDFALLMSLNDGVDDIRFKVLFRMNRPSMNRLAQKTLAAHVGQPDQQVGAFSAIWIDYWPDGMSFRVAGPKDSRFFYSPSGNPPTYVPYAQRLDEHWFWYTGG